MCDVAAGGWRAAARVQAGRARDASAGREALGLLGWGGEAPPTLRCAVNRCVRARKRGGSERKVGRRRRKWGVLHRLARDRSGAR